MTKRYDKEAPVEFPKLEDLHKAEIEFWLKRIDVQQVVDFCLQHKVEVLMQDDCQFHCFVDYKKGDGAYAIALTSFGALYQGIHEFNRQHQGKS